MTDYGTPSFASAARSLDWLLAGDFPRVEAEVVIITGQVLAAGSVLGRITASDKWNLSLSAAGDGSEVPRAILMDAVDATGADKAGRVWLTGEFADEKLVFGTAHTIASTKTALAEKGIYLKATVAS
jgi:hypothetical protein